MSQNEKPTLNEQLDACRSAEQLGASDDLAELRGALESDATVRETWDRSRKLDDQIQAAFQQVPVPSGLEAKLLAAISANAATGASNCDDDFTDNCASNVATVGRNERTTTRSRRWLVRGAAAIVAASLCAVLAAGWWGWFAPSPPISLEMLADETPRWIQATTASEPAVMATAPGSRPLSSRVKKLPGGWRRVTTTWDRYAVAFNFPSDRGRAFLFAFRRPAADDIAASLTRLPLTGAWDAGVWREGEMLYVIAVEKRAGGRLEDFVAPGPVIANYRRKNEGHSASLINNPA